MNEHRPHDYELPGGGGGTRNPPPASRAHNLEEGDGGTRNPPPPPSWTAGQAGRSAGPLRTATARPVRKLRVGAAAGLLAAVLLPLVNAALQRLGLPSVTAEDLQAVWDLGLAAYGSVAAAVAWLAAYLARPAAEDAPVPDGAG